MTDTDTATALAEADPAKLAQLILALSYVAGFGLAIVAIFEFKKHKNNPTQQTFAVEFSFPGPLTLPTVRDGALVTLTINSILNNTLELRTRKVPGGL